MYLLVQYRLADQGLLSACTADWECGDTDVARGCTPERQPRLPAERSSEEPDADWSGAQRTVAVRLPVAQLEHATLEDWTGFSHVATVPRGRVL
ncbi:hypothetical protein NDU88_004614 [Pleurodeles waltl]|uniref:Uncharacterized protein n=1 Tax=Pleurodeles waltl TaxID=8319 RepID=A0AAV7TA88_PLEWA|nr:hypothetical protein NDU88_004614 [Pleurodeles waltl]